MKIFSWLEDWSYKIFVHKALSRAVPVVAGLLSAKLLAADPEAFQKFPVETVRGVVGGIVWTATTLLQNLVKFILSKKG